MPELPSPKEFLRRLKPRLPQMLATLRQFVEAESPSLEKAAADRCYGLIASAWRKYDVRVERLAQKHRGDHLRISYGPGKTRPAGQLLVLGHYDTVYSGGTPLFNEMTGRSTDRYDYILKNHPDWLPQSK